MSQSDIGRITTYFGLNHVGKVWTLYLDVQLIVNGDGSVIWNLEIIEGEGRYACCFWMLPITYIPAVPKFNFDVFDAFNALWKPHSAS